MTPESTITAMARAARAALPALAAATAQKASAIRHAAKRLRERASELAAANAQDMAAGAARGLNAALLDRLALDGSRIEALAAGLETVAALPDPVGEAFRHWTTPNGLAFTRVRVPLGVIGIIYESRPGVTADAAALCLMSGNACLLRGGSEAAHSNEVLLDCMAQGLVEAGLPAAAIQMVPAGDRALVGAMLAAHGLIDVIIPRGGKGLVARVQADARVPVLAHLDGINHLYIDAAADPAKAVALAVNSKLRRPGVCGATETILLDAALSPATARAVLAALADAGCDLRADAAARSLEPRATAATAEDYDTEWLDKVASVATVDGVAGAIAHVQAHSSGHTDAIVTENEATARAFLTAIDSAIVMHNASTQFADGGEFGFGAEIGIATGRLHARGPVALEGLTTYKTLVMGSGQVRA
ncbi:gamma-glutamyl phosphate reductase [Polymorphobacter multimanifer]|uniref:Gamma-glutamyl phosphate reductase n=1 Tax=Polymorphobacter multimanifer TaxID=1070431 RepID=A0A841L845_9SPHN|nr:glutamate-5-semialdehyde dehydrogenase [Polymorphobacter multimanifer]MBB6228734.1 glutamate-5-semialdehyde dehydrogenase [Polymorphobacter multimanifer]GGI83799.1 gamma-glutamyl phosphate reductase [Polymorphobacter multimanifer]